MKRRAFTLVEVLVALLVAAVVIPVTLRALMLAAGFDSSTLRQRQAARLADYKLNELITNQTWNGTSTTGDFGTDYPGYRWELTTGAWQAGTTTMRDLTLTVYGPGRHGEFTVVLHTLVPDPATAT